MPIRHHVSILIGVAIVGAIGLAVTVAILIESLDGAARAEQQASGLYDQLTRIVSDVRRLQQGLQTLSGRSDDGAFARVEVLLERSQSDLKRLVRLGSADVADHVEEPIRLLAKSRVLVRDRGGVIPNPDELDHLRVLGAKYAVSIETLHRQMDRSTSQASSLVADRYRSIMLVMGILCIAFLGLVERVRVWTQRRVTRPAEALAVTARRVIEGEEELGPLPENASAELDTLSRMLQTLSETLESRVRDRTSQIERQKDSLEREVRVRRRTEEQLRHAAFHDRLTGLCNRDLLLDRLDQCLERAARHEEYDFAILFIDIDHFKEVNDTHGHFIGDQLLVASAERFQHCLRESDQVTRVESNTVARLGGDEFVILLDGLNTREDANVVAERLQHAISMPFSIQGEEVMMTASIGIAFNENAMQRADHLLRDADAAMYFAKATGKARYEVFNSRMHDAATARRRIGDELRRALAENEFELKYQPIISLRGGRLSGFEALCRWNHPQRGEISPVEFVPEAEESGVIVPLGRWVLEQACRQLKTWQSELPGGSDLSISVNVSKRQLVEPGFRDFLRDLLEEVGITGSHLKLEITESVVMECPESMTRVLEQIRTLGVRIHMDDFGTGYSSLSYLHRFPLDVLKIDRTFVGNLSNTTSYADVVRTVIAMARALDMEVTVEGVETQTQLTQLIGLDCDFAQGFYFSVPLDVAAARSVIESQPEWLRPAA